QIPEFGNIYNIYCQRCKRNGAMDFDDLLLQTNILLRDCPDVLARYQELFKYILVDEYQDTNYAQYVIIRRLSQLHSKVCVVGDDAQSIYSFRGAKIENILSFQKDFPDAKVFKLEQNYRSTRTIVEAANSVIVRNSKRMDKHCFSAGDVGEKIRILKAYTDREEAEMVVSDLRDKVRAAGDAWSEAVILYRTNNQSAVLEDNLRRRGIPYRIYKGSSFYDHKEIKDMLAYIRLVINPRDDEAFRRIVNYPARGIGDTTVQRIAQLAAERGVSMWEAVDALVAEPVTDPVQRTIARKVAEFVAMIRALSLARNDKGLYDFGMEIASRSGIIAAYRTENTPEATSALDNIEELLNSMQLFKEQRDAEIRGGERTAEEEATVEEWLQNVMLMTDMDKDDPEDSNKVTLMTVHSAKGLEYKYVYIVGMEENLFPSQRASESADGMEEERRLFYVALTRAKVSATISFAEMRFRWGNMEFSHPSRFLREIDPRYIDSDVDFSAEASRRPAGGDGTSAIDELRRRFDYRFQQKRQEGAAGRGYEAGGHGAPGGGSYGAGSRFGRPADGESGVARRFARATPQPQRTAAPDPALVRTPRPSTEGMRRLGVRPAASAAGTASAGVLSAGYEVGQRVEHAIFGAGVVRSIELAQDGDQRLVVEFGNAGTKTLLAKFAKLTKL
uniref:ATP-dependent helicase n=1 Tax=uncultured Alistipes sp. TaxID=538949 RepID=UPI00266C8509